MTWPTDAVGNWEAPVVTGQDGEDWQLSSQWEGVADRWVGAADGVTYPDGTYVEFTAWTTVGGLEVSPEEIAAGVANEGDEGLGHLRAASDKFAAGGGLVGHWEQRQQGQR